mmetsp:Transcript_61153/g.97296  ORF Transcript_61153/g.97296 Transcript_61153/m.97296 type:complete len:152 (+) Transcript_61153:43-498(+)
MEYKIKRAKHAQKRAQIKTHKITQIRSSLDLKSWFWTHKMNDIKRTQYEQTKKTKIQTIKANIIISSIKTNNTFTVIVLCTHFIHLLADTKTPPPRLVSSHLISDHSTRHMQCAAAAGNAVHSAHLHYVPQTSIHLNASSFSARTPLISSP